MYASQGHQKKALYDIRGIIMYLIGGLIRIPIR